MAKIKGSVECANLVWKDRDVPSYVMLYIVINKVYYIIVESSIIIFDDYLVLHYRFVVLFVYLAG